MLVFLAHAGLSHVVPGGFGVTIFFFLSGYLITTLLLMERAKNGTISLRNFYLRRAFRIFPPMYLVLFVGLVLALSNISRSNLTAEAVIAQFAHLTNYYTIFNGESHLIPETGPLWSLAVEEHFYLLYPLLLIVLLKRYSPHKTSKILLFLCASILMWRCYLVFVSRAPSAYTYMATDTRIDSILFGCVLALTSNPAFDNSSQQKRFKWMLLMAGGTLVLVFCFIYRSAAFRETFRYTLQGIALFPIFFCAVQYSHWPIFRWLNFRPIRGLGVISYTFYLVHLMAIKQANRWIDGSRLEEGVVAFFIAVTFSIATYYLIEIRFAALRKTLHRSDLSAQQVINKERIGYQVPPP